MFIFKKVAEFGSFSRAAAQLGLPKSSVSQKLTQLEQDLGVRLLQRTTRRVSLTEIGERVYEAATRIASDTEDIKALVQNLHEEPSGLLRVTAPLDLGAHLIEHHIGRFMARYPKITLELDLSNRLVDLVSEGYDLALRATSGSLRESSLIVQKLAPSMVGPYASPAWIARNRAPARPDDLRDCQVAATFLGARRGATTWRLRSGEHEVVVPVRAVLRCNDYLALTRAAVAGLGVVLLPEIVCGPLVARGELVRVLPEWALAVGDFYALYPSRRFLPAKTSAFVAFLRGALVGADPAG